MKIITEGAIPMPPPLWPLGSRFRCCHCRCEFVIEEFDSFRRETEERPGGDSFIYLPCPCCERELKATRPRQTTGLRHL